MTDVHAQLVAVIEEIEARTLHTPGCDRHFSEYAEGDVAGTEAIAERNRNHDSCNCTRPARVRAEIARRWEASEAKLRELLWLRHGCPISALYGDDGEMSCGACGLDFKRSPEGLETFWRNAGAAALRGGSGSP